MKLEVPFYKQTTELNCGPNALKMALDFLGKSYSVEDLEKKMGIEKGKGISTIKLAIAARNFGFKTEFFSKVLGINPENLKMDFYKKHTDLNQENEAQKLLEEARNAGVRLYEKALSLEEIIKNIKQDRIMIVLLDWNVISEKEGKGYQGHLVPIVGYNNGIIYIHQPSPFNAEPKSFLPVKKEIFERARKAKGTDEDIVIIYKK